MLKETLTSLYGLILQSIILIVSVIFEKIYHTGYLDFAIYALVISVPITFLLLLWDKIKAYCDLLRFAKIHGFWKNESLNKQINKYFNESRLVKIKVTRGSIFADNNNAFHQCIINGNEGRATTARIQILLHYPCQKSCHIIARANAHQENHDAYLAKLYETILSLLNAKRIYNLNLDIRLYGDQQIKWRFYIFKNGSMDNTLLLNYYNDNRGGNLTPMLKVKGSNNPDYPTLCDSFDKEFDDIFTHKSFAIDELFTSELGERKKLLECHEDTSSCESCHENFKENAGDIIRIIRRLTRL